MTSRKSEPTLELHGGSRWELRSARARELQSTYTAAGPVLRFYASILEFQGEVARHSAVVARPATPLREQIDPTVVLGHIPDLLRLTCASGPPLLAARAKELQQASTADWREMFLGALQIPPSLPDELTAFFPRACLQPLAENLQRQMPAAVTSDRRCPTCGGEPQAAVLRPEGDGAARWLLCSFCLREWLYRRLVCPSCGEENPEKLPRYGAPECGHIRLEACDSCHRYLKAVDLTVEGHAIPLVDEVAAGVLDVWAGQQGHTKIVPNLMGL